MPVVRKILSGSETPPIIIIQSDHGYVDGKVQSPNILNAYFLPDAGDKHLYSTISPVNTFRIIFNQYLVGHYQLLGRYKLISQATNRPTSRRL